MSENLVVEREKIERQIRELEQSLGPESNLVDLVSSDSCSSDEGSDDNQDPELGGDLAAKRERIKREIEELENTLGPVADGDVVTSSSEDEDEELGLPQTTESCLQMNLVYQEVLNEKLADLEKLLAENRKQQREVQGDMCGLGPRITAYNSQSQRLYMGSFLKPYFKDKLTGLGPPANPETKDKMAKTNHTVDDTRLKQKRWEGWQKSLLINSVARDCMKKRTQPKLSKVDYLTQKLSKANSTEKIIIRQQIAALEKEIEEISAKKEEELIGERLEDHDWQKISNIDFEGTREADDIQRFWQNFLHPSIDKSKWDQDEIDQLATVAERNNATDWAKIAEELGTNRSAFMCLQTYQRYVSKTFKRSVWSPEEDAVLNELVDKMRIGNYIPYTQICYFMGGRDPAQAMYRWTQVLDPTLRKGHWSRKEDKLLLKAVAKYGVGKWWKIRMEVPGRNDGQCRDRYLDNLQVNLKKGSFDDNEIELLIQGVEKHGVGKWAKIATGIPNRMDAQCMRTWQRLSRICKKQKQDNQIQTKRRRDSEANTRRKKVALKLIKRRLFKMEDEETDSTEEEEEGAVEYMDSDDDKKKIRDIIEQNEGQEAEKEEAEEKEEEEKEEEEVEIRVPFVVPPLDKWIPAPLPETGFTLSGLRVAMPSPSSAAPTDPDTQTNSSPRPGPPRRKSDLRCTILDRKWRHVGTVIGPQPVTLARKDQSCRKAMINYSLGAICNFIIAKRKESFKRSCLARSPRVAYRRSQKTSGVGRPAGGASARTYKMILSATTHQYELMHAVAPWVGNVLIPATSRSKITEADTLRERAEAVGLTSTPVFLLLLQVAHVDTQGCKSTIQKRKHIVYTPAPIGVSKIKQSPYRSIATVAELLEEERSQRLLHMQQREQLKQQQKAKVRPLTPWMMLPQKPPNMRPPMFPQLSHNMDPRMSVQMLPRNVRPQMFPHLSPNAGHRMQVFPQAFFITPPGAPSTSVPMVLPGQQLLPCQPSSHPAPVTPQSISIIQLSETPSQPTTTTTTTTTATLVAPAAIQPTASPQSAAPQSVATTSQPTSTPTQSPAATTTQPAATTTQPAATTTQPPTTPTQSPAMTTQPATSPTQSSAATTQPAATTTQPAATTTQPATTPTQSAATTTQPTTTPIQSPAATAQPDSTPTQPSATLSPAPAPKPSRRCSKKAPLSASAVQAKALSSGEAEASESLSGRKRTRKLSEKAKAMIEVEKAMAKSPKRKRARRIAALPEPNAIGQSPQSTAATGQPIGQPSPLTFAAPQVAWIMTPNGPVPLISVGPVRLQMGPLPPSDQLPKISIPRLIRPATPMATQILTNSPPTHTLSLSPAPAQVAGSPQPVSFIQYSKQTPLQPKLLTSTHTPRPQLLASTHTPQPQLLTSTHTPQPQLLTSAHTPRPQLLTSTHTPRPQLLTSTHTPRPQLLTSTHTPQPDPDASSLPVCLPYGVAPTPGLITLRVPPPRPPSQVVLLPFNHALLFREGVAEVLPWSKGTGGVTVPGLDGSPLPYLPPFVSNITALAALLRKRSALIASALELLPCGAGIASTRDPNPGTSSQTAPKNNSNTPPDPNQTGASGPGAGESPDATQEERIAVIRLLVKERFDKNPAYQLLKARFLSCFTFPALLATIQPMASPCVGKEDAEEELEPRKEKNALLLREGQGEPAAHYSGMMTRQKTNLTTSKQPEPEAGQFPAEPNLVGEQMSD